MAQKMKEFLREPQLSVQLGENEGFNFENYHQGWDYLASEAPERAFEQLFEDDMDMGENNSQKSNGNFSKVKEVDDQPLMNHPPQIAGNDLQKMNRQNAQKAPRKSIKHLPQKAPRKSIGCRGKPMKKPRKWKKGTVAIREIKKYQKGVELLIPKAKFVRLIRDIANRKRQDDPLRFSAE